MANGFDPSEYISNLDFENQQLRQKNIEMAGALTGGFNEQEEQNLIQYQLDTDKVLERCEHYLKGDQIKFNENGAYFSEPTKKVLTVMKKDPITKIIYYIQEIKEGKKGSEKIKEVLVKITNKNKQEIDVMEGDSKIILKKIKNLRLQDRGYRYIEIIDEEKKPMNDYGVYECMRILSNYVTKETFLSYYTEERINEILYDLGNELNKFVYCNYEKMGMDTKFKESKYAMLILNILNIIESCYRRAIGGNEQMNLRTRASVIQSQGLGGGGMMSKVPSMKKKWHPLKPSTW